MSNKKLGIAERDQRRYDKANVDCARRAGKAGKAFGLVAWLGFGWIFLDLEDWRIRDRLVGLSNAHSSDR